MASLDWGKVEGGGGEGGRGRVRADQQQHQSRPRRKTDLLISLHAAEAQIIAKPPWRSVSLEEAFLKICCWRPVACLGALRDNPRVTTEKRKQLLRDQKMREVIGGHLNVEAVGAFVIGKHHDARVEQQAVNRGHRFSHSGTGSPDTVKRHEICSHMHHIPLERLALGDVAVEADHPRASLEQCLRDCEAKAANRGTSNHMDLAALVRQPGHQLGRVVHRLDLGRRVRGSHRSSPPLGPLSVREAIAAAKIHKGEVEARLSRGFGSFHHTACSL